jgi:hypothetical protein
LDLEGVLLFIAGISLLRPTKPTLAALNKLESKVERINPQLQVLFARRANLRHWGPCRQTVTDEKRLKTLASRASSRGIRLHPRSPESRISTDGILLTAELCDILLTGVFLASVDA